MKKRILILAAAFLLLAMTACAQKEEPAAEVSAVPTAEPTPTPTSTPTPTPTPTATPTPEPKKEVKNGKITEFEGYPNPLSGELEKTDLLKLRPYVYMCNNISVSMPHCGVSQSDLIMEMMEEGGITRMMVFFADPSDVEKIGSIRSARAYNVDTALGYDAILAHCGGSDEALEMIASYGMQDMDQMTGGFGEDVFYRDPDRQAYGSVHSLFAVGSGCVKAAKDRDYRLEHEDGYDTTYGLQFDENAKDQCTQDAKEINIVYAGGKTTDFQYDQKENTYTMYQYGEEYTDDGETKVPFSNVIMIYANTYMQNDGQHLTIELNEGDGFFFTGGKAVPIRWVKNGAEDVFHYMLEDGTELKLTPGRTFVAVNQTDSGFIEY